MLVCNVHTTAGKLNPSCSRFAYWSQDLGKDYEYKMCMNTVTYVYIVFTGLACTICMITISSWLLYIKKGTEMEFYWYYQ